MTPVTTCVSTQTAFSMSSLGVPVKLLHESLGHMITVELKTGQLYRGKLAEGRLFLIGLLPPKLLISTAEDSLNISMRDITVTGRDGRISQLDQVYIRGSMIRFFIVPDMLQNAPMSVLSGFGIQYMGIFLIFINLGSSV